MLAAIDPITHASINRTGMVTSVAEPKLFVSAPAPAPTFKKFQSRSQLWLRDLLTRFLIGKVFMISWKEH